MKPAILSRKVLVILLCLLFWAPIPGVAGPARTAPEGVGNRHRDVIRGVSTVAPLYAGSEGWVDQLAGFVVVQEEIARIRGDPGSFHPYVGQILLVRSLYERGDWKGSYMAMNRFMDMLEAREEGISDKAADAMWDYCYEVTPPALHDVKRHKQWWDKTVNWEKFFWEE